MDGVVGRGKGWRDDMSEFLWGHGIGVLNPCNNPVIGALKEDDGYYEEINALKKLGMFEEVEKKAKQIVRQDLHLVDLCSAMILLIDKDIHMCGSYAEQTYNCLEHKPLIVCCPQGKENIPNFVFGMGASHIMFYQTWSEVKSYIEQVCYAETFPAQEKWRFIDFTTVFGLRKALKNGT